MEPSSQLELVKPVNILLVDDTESNLFILEVMLKDLGQNLFKAQSGTEALKILLEHDISLILMDVRMPGMDGFEAAALIRQRERYRNTPIIFITAFDLREKDLALGYSLGGVDFVFKPFEPEILKTKVGIFVDLFRKTEQLLQQSSLLQNYAEELEKRVRRRTAELSRTNEQLSREVAERKKTETQLKESLQQKEVLLKEVHHRVKNNLQIISSLLNLQAERTTANAQQALRNSQGRIRAIALVHEKLYQSDDLGRIHMGDYLESLGRSLFLSGGLESGRIGFAVHADEVYFDMDRAVPCGMIVYELLANSVKYAFPNGRAGNVDVTFRRGEGGHQITLEVSDTGIGLPKEFDFRSTDSLGFQLVCRLADQLKAELTLAPTSGTTFRVTFGADIGVAQEAVS